MYECYGIRYQRKWHIILERNSKSQFAYVYLDTFWWTLGQVRRKSNVIYSIVNAGWFGILLIMNLSKLLSIKNIEVKHNSNNVGWWV